MFGKKESFFDVAKKRLVSVEKAKVFEKFYNGPAEKEEEAKAYYEELFEKFRDEVEEKDYETIKEMVEEYLSFFKKLVDNVNFVFNSKVEDALEIAREFLQVAEEFEPFDENVREYIKGKEEFLYAETASNSGGEEA